MEGNYSLSDLAAVTGNEGFGGTGGGIWLLIILIFLMGGNGFGWNRGNDFSQFATASSQNELLLGQKFDAIGRQINQVGDGIASLGYNQLQQMDNIRYDMATQFAASNANTTAQTQKILDAMAANKIESLQAEVNSLKTANMFNGVPRISPYMYNVVPSCGCCNTTAF